jgi:phosphomannomutase/phosphoglucomutase
MLQFNSKVLVMLDTIFREYDIRGKVGSEFLLDDVYTFSRALAYYFVREMPQIKTVAVGMDGRTSSEPIKNELVKGFLESGLNVTFIGVCPTPVLYFASFELSADAAVMITASHNPKEYNGIKLVLNKKTIWGKQIQEIRELFKAGKKVDAAQSGTLQEYLLVDSYINWLANHFNHLKNSALSAVVDCGNGTGGIVMVPLIQRMGWKNVQLLYEEVDGNYPNHEADPVVEKNMADVKKILATTNVSVGIGLDGDCDRMAAMTQSGFLVPGDQLLAVFAQEVLKDFPGRAVVFDVKCSQGLIELLEQWNAKPCISPAGHAIIKGQMAQHNAVLAGELSCHFFFHDRYFGYDDGIYAMMRLFEILQNTGSTLEQLVEIFPKKYTSAEIRLACKEDQKKEIIETITQEWKKNPEAQLITIDGVRVTLPYGWAIVRASNTQPVLSMRFESSSLEGLLRIKNDFIRLLSNYFDTTVVRKELDVQS